MENKKLYDIIPLSGLRHLVLVLFRKIFPKLLGFSILHLPTSENPLVIFNYIC